MAGDKIDLIVVPQVLADLEKTIKLVDELNKKILGVKTISGATNIAVTMKNQEDSLNASVKKTTESFEKRRLAELKLAQDREKAMDRFEKTKGKELDYQRVLKEREVLLKKHNELINQTIALEQKKQSVLAKSYNSTKELDKINKAYEILNNRVKESTASLIKLDSQIHKTGDSSPVPKLQVVANRQNVDDRQSKELEKQNQALARQQVIAARLAEPYNKLKAALAQATVNLQNLIASGTASNREIRVAQKEFDTLSKRVQQADKAVNKFSQSNNLFAKSLGTVSNLMGAFGISTGLYLGASIVADIYKTSKALNSLELALKIVSDGELEFAKNQKFLLTTAEDYGIEIKGLTKNFTEFWVASKGKLDAEEIKGIFASISKSAAVMGLSVEAQDSAFLALQQMMSKGTVQAEELKKQLGNSLPGAIKAATQAYQVLHPEMKVTEELFMSQMKAGKVVSSELLPELARQFEIIYGVESITRVDTMQAAQERMANSWTAWIKGLSSNSSTTKAIVAVMNGLAASLNEIVGVLLISVGSWAAYKLAIMLANVQNKLLMLTITGTTVATEAQVVVTGFQTTAQVANTVATSAATKAWKGLTLAMKANALGLIIVGLGLLVTAFQHFSKSAVEADDDIKELNSQFIVNREIMTESIIETNTMIKRYEELRDKAKDLGGATKLTKDEQKELNGLLAGLSKLVPNAVSDIDKYGKAVALNTGLLREWNKEQKEILRIKLANALRTEKENYADLVEEVADLEQTYKDLKTARLGSFEGAEQIVVDAELEYRTAKQRMILSKQRIKDLSGETQAEKNLKKAKDESQQALIKDVAYYEAKIAGMEERRPRLKTRQEGLDFQKEMDGYVKMRDFLQGEEEKINKKENKDQTDRLKRIEDANKSIFESELAVLEAKREIAKDDLELSTKSVGEKIVLARKLMEAELAIIERTFKEKQRLAKLEVKKNPLLNFDTVVTPDKEKSKTDSANATQARVATIGKVYSDFFKKANEDLGVSEELWNKYIKSLEMTDEDKERLKKWEEAMKLLKDGINDAFNMFAGDFADRIGFTDSFDLLMGKDGKDTTMFERLKDGEGAWKDYALAITTVMQDAFNFINQQDDMRHQAQLERLTEQKEVALTFAGESAAAKEKIESDYEKKRKQLDNRRAKDKKKQAMFNIALDTAQAVMTTLKEGGFFASPLAIAVAAMGAVQLAMVAAQKIPEYYVGTKNADEGWALTNERGAEIVTDKKGNIKDFGDKRGAKMQYLSKGDIVYTSEETKRLMFENEYNSLLDANGINQPKVVVSQGATASEIREVMIETLGGRPTLNMKFDKGGFVTYISKNGNITRSSEQRGSGIGIEL